MRQPASRKASFAGSSSRQQFVKEERREGTTRESSSSEKEEKRQLHQGGVVVPIGSYNKNEHTVRLRRNKAEQERREVKVSVMTEREFVKSYCSRLDISLLYL